MPRPRAADFLFFIGALLIVAVLGWLGYVMWLMAQAVLS